MNYSAKVEDAVWRAVGLLACAVVACAVMGAAVYLSTRASAQNAKVACVCDCSPAKAAP